MFVTHWTKIHSVQIIAYFLCLYVGEVLVKFEEEIHEKSIEY